MVTSKYISNNLPGYKYNLSVKIQLGSLQGMYGKDQISPAAVA